MKKGRHKKEYIIQLYLYRILENVNFPTVTEKRSVVPWGEGQRERCSANMSKETFRGAWTCPGLPRWC